MISDQKAITNHLQNAIKFYQIACKHYAAGTIGNQREAKLQSYITTFAKKTDHGDLTDILDFYLKEEGSKSRLIGYLTAALYQIFQINDTEHKPLKRGPRLAASIERLVCEKTKKALLHDAIKTYLNEYSYTLRLA